MNTTLAEARETNQPTHPVPVSPALLGRAGWWLAILAVVSCTRTWAGVDIEIIRAEVVPEQPEPGKPMRVAVTYRNRGTDWMMGQFPQIYIWSDWISEETRKRFPKGNNSDELAWPRAPKYTFIEEYLVGPAPTNEGPHKVLVIMNPNSEFREDSLNNNLRFVSYSVVRKPTAAVVGRWRVVGSTRKDDVPFEYTITSNSVQYSWVDARGKTRSRGVRVRINAEKGKAAYPWWFADMSPPGFGSTLFASFAIRTNEAGRTQIAISHAGWGPQSATLEKIE